MKKLTSNQIRKLFLEYFEKQKHMIEPSANLVPINDPTLLWINSGVAALKKYFDGREKPRNNRICNSQKCIRTNDIENVGKTARHHTFFEMLGNFSIGDYFREEALKFAWEFLTDENYIGFEKERIYVTVYEDDKESYDIWVNKIGLDPKHILKTKSNFWQIGEGPCGPDSEIFYDRGKEYDPLNLGEKLFFEEMENDRYIEVWNVVFSQYDAKDGVDRKDFKELPQKNIDTGMGLERLVALVQNGETNFDTDLFLPIINKISEKTKFPYKDQYKMAYRVICDHIRTVTFALSDGASFSNEGRGYVLRRVLRRAVRYNIKLGINKPFMYELVDVVANNMKEFYPYLMEKIEFVKEQIKKEEESFYQTLKNGEKLLSQALKDAKKTNILDGEVIFKLYDTYGYPKELTFEVANDEGLDIDYEGFEKAMQRQKENARSARNEVESLHNQSIDLLNYDGEFSFTGYENNTDKATIKKLLKDGSFVNEIIDEGAIILDRTCFYSESGGQCSDIGYIKNDNLLLEVKDVKKAPRGQFIHYIKVIKGKAIENEEVFLEIDYQRRKKIMANHSSLHLLHSALRKILGNHVAQAGSFVCDEYARFDFFHHEKISFETLNKIEMDVNNNINKSIDVITKILPLEEAKKEEGVIALFDEKYEDIVRIVCMGDVSKEFCGGTHVLNTSELGSFKIINEESVGSGIRRIECQTKMFSYESFKKYEYQLNEIKEILKLKSISSINDKLESIVTLNNDLTKQNEQLQDKIVDLEANKILSMAKEYDNFKYLIIEAKNIKDLKNYANVLKEKLGKSIVFVAMKNDEKINFVCVVDKELTNKYNSKDILNIALSMTEGRGGGKPEASMGAGVLKKELKEIFEQIRKNIEK